MRTRQRPFDRTKELGRVDGTPEAVHRGPEPDNSDNTKEQLT